MIIKAQGWLCVWMGVMGEGPEQGCEAPPRRRPTESVLDAFTDALGHEQPRWVAPIHMQLNLKQPQALAATYR